MANQGSNTHMMKQGPGPASLPQHTGASPQQQLPPQPQQVSTMPGIHFPNVPTTSQSSRPKTPNRASPRPYHHPLTPTNRPPSTEPSEINLSPERLNASIAGLFPPKINIPLPPRQPNLNRGFDQQGLNPTTLKAIGQAPPNLTLPGNNSAGGNNNNNQQPFSAGPGGGGAGTKQDKQSGGPGKRASPSNSRRSSPASSRKSATPSPGRQKGPKMAIGQQQSANPQGQNMVLTPTSVPPSPVSMPSQLSGSVEAQQSSFHGMQGNNPDGVRECQGMVTAEKRQMPQPQAQPQSLRDLSAPRMASPRFPTPQQPKPDLELQAGTVERQPTHATVQDSDVPPGPKVAPTSLNQLLDNAGAPAVPLGCTQSNTVTGKDSPKSALDPEKQLSNSQSTDMSAALATTASVNESDAKAKPAVLIPTCSPNLQPVMIPCSRPSPNMGSSTTPSLNQSPVSSLSVSPSLNVNTTLTQTLCTNTNVAQSVSPKPVTYSQSNLSAAVSTTSNSSPALNTASTAVKQTPSPKPGVPSVIQIPPSSSSISPNQITVFVTSNPITSAPTSQVPTTMVSTMVAVPNKNIRQLTPVTRPPHFITTTPVFINPIFQVSNASVAPNTTVVSQSVTMVGPIQVSTPSIQLSSAPSSTQSSGTNMTQLVRSTVGQVQTANSVSSSAPVGSLPPSQQVNPGTPKTEHVGDAGFIQKSSPPVRQSSPHPSPSASAPFQAPLASPPPCASPGGMNTLRKGPMSPSSTAPLKSKPVQVAVAVSGATNSQQSPVEKPAPGPPVAVSPQVFHPPASPVIPKEAAAPQTTALNSSKIITSPKVSSPTLVPVPTPIASQAAVSAPTSVSSPAQVATSQTPLVTVVATPTVVSSASLVSMVPQVPSPVPSIAPVLTVPGQVQEVASSKSSPLANPSVVPQTQTVPPAEPSTPQAPASAETTPNTPGKHNSEALKELVVYTSR